MSAKHSQMIRSFARFGRIMLILTVLCCPGLSYALSQGKLFASPEEAVSAFVQAAQAKDNSKLLEILGPSAKDLLNGGDPVAAAAALEEFNSSFAQQHRLEQISPTTSVLLIGSNDWPFPIPLVNYQDKWFFDTEAGREEILNRRIGENELNTIDVCRAFVDAQTEYAVTDPNKDGAAEFAKQIVSTEGSKNGLYWPVKEGEPLSPLGPLFAQATAEGYKQKTSDKDSFHGYHYAMLYSQGAYARGGKKSYLVNGKMTGGYALIAYPAQWGVSGIMTFMVNQDGQVYQKNLGPKTSEIAPTIKEFNPGPGWKLAEEESLQ